MEDKDDNVYASATYYDINGGALELGCNSNKGPVTPAQTANGSAGKGSKNKLWRIVVVIVVAINIGLFATILGILLGRSSGSSITETDTGIKSCDELRKQGSSESGIYKITPNSNFPPIQVYCDMETDGGGWTLVSSVHESNIHQKCFSDDLWSGYVPYFLKTTPGKTSWSNEMTFGALQKCVDDDYKNNAYYSLHASDLMMWHVKSGAHVDHIKSSTTLRYRTNNNFLKKYGGNLKSLFDEHYPLEIQSGGITPTILNAISGKSEEIMSEIPNWYNYAVGAERSIDDNTLYHSTGSAISFGSSTFHHYSSLIYGRIYSLDKSYSNVKTSVSKRPLLLVEEIQNEDGTDSEYEIRVTSTGNYSSDYLTIPELQGEISEENYVLQYRAVQLYESGRNVPCEMFFVVSNFKEWKSTHPLSFYRSHAHYRWNSRDTYYKITGNPAKLIFGYILLARTSGNKFTTDHLNNVSRVILQAISTARHGFPALNANRSLTVPVVFDKGNTDDVINIIPPKYQRYIEPGFLQFRAYNFSGYPNAVCPGIKGTSLSPEYYCVGGISGNIGEYGTCGDFSGWGGKSSDTILYSLASGSAHAQKDIISTILFFYR